MMSKLAARKFADLQECACMAELSVSWAQCSDYSNPCVPDDNLQSLSLGEPLGFSTNEHPVANNLKQDTQNTITEEGKNLSSTVSNLDKNLVCD